MKGRLRIARKLAAGFAAAAVLLGAASFVSQGLASHLASLPFAREHFRLAPGIASKVPGTVSRGLREGAIRAAAAAGASAFLSVPAVSPGAGLGILLLTAAADAVTGTRDKSAFAPGPDRPGPDSVVLEIRKFEGRLRKGGVRTFRTAGNEYPPLANRRMPDGLDWTFGYHALPLARYLDLYEALRARQDKGGLALLNVRYIVSSGRPPSVERAPEFLPRAFLAVSLLPCGNLASVAREMSRPGWDPRKVATDSPLGGGMRTYGLEGGVILRPGRDELTAQMYTIGPGLAVFSEVWYPAWKAFVDGRRARVLRAWGALRAVEVPSGTHTVRMVYDSVLFKAGLWLTFLSASLLGFAAFGGRRRPL